MKVELKTADGRDVMVLVDPEASPIEIADSLEATANAPAQTQGAAKPVRWRLGGWAGRSGQVQGRHAGCHEGWPRQLDGAWCHGQGHRGAPWTSSTVRAWLSCWWITWPSPAQRNCLASCDLPLTRALGDQPCHHRAGRAQRRRCRLRPDRTGAGRRVRRGRREEDAPVFDRRQRRRAAALARERVASSV